MTDTLYLTNECMYLLALVSCLRQSEVPNQKVVEVIIPRVAINATGESGKYINRGHVFVRFSEEGYMDQVQNVIDRYERFVECDARGIEQQRLRCRIADRDISSMSYSMTGVPVWERARYFGEAFVCFRMD